MSRMSHAEALITAVVVALLLCFMLARVVHGHPSSGWLRTDSRDVVFLCPTGHTADNPVACANRIWFNGDWHGATLCRAGHCVAYDSIFPEGVHVRER